MSSSGTPARPALSAQRLAAIAAAEARLAGQPNPNTPEARRAARPPPPPWAPTEKGDKEKRQEFTRLLDRGIVRDNGYKQAAECVETLIKIAGNIIDQTDEAKFKNLKATNNTLKNKILLIKGGEEYLIALGFRTTTVDFTKVYVFEPTPRRMHELKLGREVLSEQLVLLQSRVSTAPTGNATAEEAARKARALRLYEEDRDQVKERAAREKIVREVREKAKREAEAAEALRLAEEEAQAAAAPPQDNQSDKVPESEETYAPPGAYRADSRRSTSPHRRSDAATATTGVSPNEESGPSQGTGTGSTPSRRETREERAARKAQKLPHTEEELERETRRMEKETNMYVKALSASGVRIGGVSSSGMDSILSGMVRGARGTEQQHRNSPRDYRPGQAQAAPSFAGEGQTLGGGRSQATQISEPAIAENEGEERLGDREESGEQH